VAAFLANNFVTVVRPNFYGDEVAHAARGNEKRCFFAENLGSTAFESTNGGVFEIDVVANFGFGHGATHRESGPRDSVAAQIDNAGVILRGLQFPIRIRGRLCRHAFRSSAEKLTAR
jgi:hypothetical protein